MKKWEKYLYEKNIQTRNITRKKREEEISQEKSRKEIEKETKKQNKMKLY